VNLEMKPASDEVDLREKSGHPLGASHVFVVDRVAVAARIPAGSAGADSRLLAMANLGAHAALLASDFSPTGAASPRRHMPVSCVVRV